MAWFRSFGFSVFYSLGPTAHGVWSVQSTNWIGRAPTPRKVYLMIFAWNHLQQKLSVLRVRVPSSLCIFIWYSLKDNTLKWLETQQGLYILSWYAQVVLENLGVFLFIWVPIPVSSAKVHPHLWPPRSIQPSLMKCWISFPWIKPPSRSCWPSILWGYWSQTVEMHPALWKSSSDQTHTEMWSMATVL